MDDRIAERTCIVLTENPDLYSVQRIVDSAQRLGFGARAVNPIMFVSRVGGDQGGLFFYGRPIPRSLMIVPRVSHALPEFGWMVLRHFEHCGFPVLNAADCIQRAQHKFASLQELSAAGLPVPRSFCTRTPLSLPEALEFCGGLPVIVKMLRGSQGVGVIYVDSEKTLKSLLETVCNLGHNMLMQQYIPEAAAGDVRAVVLGGRVLASMSRITSIGEFRSNIHKGARAEAVALSGEEEAMCVRAAAVFGLTLAGVDFARTAGGPVFFEVNPNPGFEGIEGATGMDVAGEVVRFMARRAGLAPSV